MEHLFQWLMAHQALCGIAATLVSFIIGWALPSDKLMKVGFFVSQFIRKTFGAKLEEKIEDVVDAFDKGMKGDNPK